MRNLLLLLVLLTTTPVLADVYRTVDEDGNVIFTDQPSPGAERIEIRKIPTIEAPPPRLLEEEAQAPALPEPPGYSKLEITFPVDDTSVRDNAGNVTVNVSLEPALSPNDKLVLYMDGAKAQEGASPQFSLANVDRGIHSLSVAVVDKDGSELKRSNTVSFTLHRISKPGPQPQKPAQKPAP
jgi:hypothetical protein